MVAIFGKIDSYDGELEEWPQYVERLGHSLLQILSIQSIEALYFPFSYWAYSLQATTKSGSSR